MFRRTASTTLPTMSFETEYEAMLRQIEENIREHGRHIACIPKENKDVFQRHPETNQPIVDFAYTIRISGVQPEPHLLSQCQERLPVAEPHLLPDDEGTIPVPSDSKEVVVGWYPLWASCRLQLPSKQVKLADDDYTCQKPEDVPVVLLRMPNPTGITLLMNLRNSNS